MELTVVDRVILMSVLPKEGDISTLKILRDLMSEIGFTEEEVQKLEMSSSEKGTTWKQDEGIKLNKEIDIGPRAYNVIEGAFRKISEAKKLTLEHLPTFEKFVKD